jgi:WD40 repeat protein
MIRLDLGWLDIRRIWFLPDGKDIVAQLAANGVRSTADDYVRVALANPTVAKTLHHPAPNHSGVLSLDLAYVAGVTYGFAATYVVTGIQVCNVSGRVWTDSDLSFDRLTLTFSADATRLWGVGSMRHPQVFEDTVLAWATIEGRRLFRAPAPTVLDALVPSPDNLLAVGCAGSADELFFLNVADESWKRTGSLPTRVYSLEWCPDSRTVAVGTSDGLGLVHAATGRLSAPARARRQPVTAVAVHPSRPLLLSGSGDGEVRLWQCGDNTLTARESFDWQVGRVTALAISRDCTLAAVGGADGQIVVWDLEV